MYLLDTHTLIWAITDDDKLSDKAKGISFDAGVRIPAVALSSKHLEGQKPRKPGVFAIYKNTCG